MNQRGLLFGKVYGCLLGGLVGDAMGAPAEEMTYAEIQKTFGYIRDFEGSGTDDSAIKLILTEAILAHGGHVGADEFAEAFLRNKKNYYNYFFIPVRNMFHKIESGLALPVYAGMGNMQSSSSAMAISPMGVINACNPRRAVLETYEVAGLIHGAEATFCRDGACVIAAAVAEAMRPGATVESILAESVRYLHPKSSAELTGCVEAALELARRAGEYEAFRAEFYKRHLRDIISDSRETVPCVLALVLLAKGDAVTAIEYGANFGRDADTIATMAGAICGALGGVGSLRPEWVARVEAGYGKTQQTSGELCGTTAALSPDQAELAERLIEVLLARSEEERACLRSLEHLAAEA